MRATLFSSSGRPDQAFRIAVAAAIIVGVAELLAVALHYSGRARAAKKAAAPAVTQAPGVATTLPSSQPVTPSSATTAGLTKDLASSEQNLIKEAAAFREKGDTANALARLQSAAEKNPTDPTILAEMAMIYESVQLFDRSSETWQRLRDLGPSAGPLYELADMKLKAGAATTAPSTALAGPGFAGVSPLDSGAMRNSPDGIPEGSTFGIAEATITENPDPEAETNLTLRVSVKVRANTLIDHTKVKIQVYFYDTVENNKVALTDAEVNYEWVTPDHDWKNTNPEILEVKYLRLKNGALSTEAALAEAAAAVTPPTAGRKAGVSKQPAGSAGNRKFAGYQIRVYYLDQLQDVRAEPTKLLNLFPPPLTLSAP